jgi:Domain of Unknown Function (DUF928)
MKQFLSISMRISLIAMAALVFIPPPIADAKYRPRNRRPPTRSITQLGSRDTCDGKKLVVTALAPRQTIPEFGQQPKSPLTLAWSITTPSVASQLEVDIYQLGETQAFVTSLPVRQIGNKQLVAATLDRPLEAGEYAWQLTYRCKQTAKPIVPFQEFTVSALPAAVEKSIGKVKSPEQRSQIYAEAGFWYNALDEALISQQPETLADLLVDLE